MHPRAAEFVECARDRYGLSVDVEEFAEGTKTAADAADQIGCDVAQIASSIVMDAAGDLVVVVTSGANRVDEERLAAAVGCGPGDVSMADPDRVADVIGWSIGGVPPLCHDADVPVFIDGTLLEFETVWAAGGTPTAVWPVDPEQLRELAEATPISVAE